MTATVRTLTKLVGAHLGLDATPNKPVELTIDDEVEHLNQRGIELVYERQSAAAVTAFEKALTLAWVKHGHAGEPGEARREAQDLVTALECNIRDDAAIVADGMT